MKDNIVKVTLDEGAIMPTRATDGSSGWDLYTTERVLIQNGKVSISGTGVKLQLPTGWEAQVRSRSGLASKGAFIVNGVGTIDSDYRGEIKVIMSNASGDPIWLEKGSRIAQLVFMRVPSVKLELAVELDETVRGEGGLGSTGA